jgi:uncharacterized protein involved in oxidation of intracellular sulfur
MKQLILLIFFMSSFAAMSKVPPAGDREMTREPLRKIGMIIHSNDPETVWNAFRFGNFALGEGDSVKVFLLAKGVESESLDTEKFNVSDQINRFVENGGKIFACGTCLVLRKKEGSDMCPVSTMQDMYDIIVWSTKLLTF